MTRIMTRQPAVARPVGIYITGLSNSYTKIVGVPDYSVPDPNKNWPDTRDPDDVNRRIVPGMLMLEAPMLFHNTGSASVNLDIRITTEDGVSVNQASVVIPAGDTYQHPCPGQRLIKQQIATTEGDIYEAKASIVGVVHVTGAGSVGSAEQDQPEQQSIVP